MNLIALSARSISFRCGVWDGGRRVRRIIETIKQPTYTHTFRASHARAKLSATQPIRLTEHVIN